MAPGAANNPRTLSIDVEDCKRRLPPGPVGAPGLAGGIRELSSPHEHENLGAEIGGRLSGGPLHLA